VIRRWVSLVLACGAAQACLGDAREALVDGGRGPFDASTGLASDAGRSADGGSLDAEALDTLGTMDGADSGPSDAGCDALDYSPAVEVMTCGLSGPIAVCRLRGQDVGLTYGGRVYVDGREVYSRAGASFHSPHCSEQRLVWIDARTNEILAYDGVVVSVLARDTTSAISSVYSSGARLVWSTLSGGVYVRDAKGVRTATTAGARVSRVASEMDVLAWVKAPRAGDVVLSADFGGVSTSTTIARREGMRIDSGPVLVTDTGVVVAAFGECSDTGSCRSTPTPECCASYVVRMSREEVSRAHVPHPGAVFGMTTWNDGVLLAMPRRIVRSRTGGEFDSLVESRAGTPRFVSVVDPFMYWADPRIGGDVVREDGMILRMRLDGR
jgi:hypothetical protein